MAALQYIGNRDTHNIPSSVVHCPYASADLQRISISGDGDQRDLPENAQAIVHGDMPKAYSFVH